MTMRQLHNTIMTTSSNLFPNLIYCDAALLVADKPAGMLAVPGRGTDKQDCFSARIQQEYSDALVVHRLDMATSGLMVFARGVEMQRRLSQMFREREMEKRYVAIVTGKLDADGEIDLPLGPDWPNRPKQKVDYVSGKHSLTRYRLLAHDVVTQTSRIELEPVTGRTHQLRVHLAATEHSIIGDSLYGGRASHRLMLHASMLNFAHPLGGERLSFQNAPPF